MYKAKVVLSSENGTEWQVDRVDYITKAKDAYSKPDFIGNGILVEGTLLKKTE